MLAALFTASAAILALGSICRSEIRAFRLGRSKRHAVVCGVGDKATALIRDLRNQNVRVVAIDLNADKRLMRNCEGAEVFAMDDDATRLSCLAKARVQDARQVFITTGNDSTNVEIASQVINLLRSRGRAQKEGRLACHVHLVDRQTNELFRQNHVFQEAVPLVDVRVFNVYDNAARLLWRRQLMARGPVAPTDRRRMHVVIGGLGQMGEAVLLRVVKSGHFANGRKSVITIVDRQPELVRGRVRHRYPALETICELEFVEGDINLPDTARTIGACLARPDEIGTVVLCADHNHENFAAALQMASSVARSDIPIFVRLGLAAGLAELLKSERSESALARQLEAFGLVADCCAAEAVLEDDLFRFAGSFHQAYVRSRLRAGVAPTDASLKDWNDLDEQFRESSCEQAEHMELKLRTFGFAVDSGMGAHAPVFTDEQVQVLARMEHARWCAERWLAGWTYAPPPKNAVRRTSPHLVPWEQLEESIRQVDYDTVRSIPAIVSEFPSPTEAGTLPKISLCQF